MKCARGSNEESDRWDLNTVSVPLTCDAVKLVMIITNEFRSFVYSTGVMLVERE
jgi:hypothetical protein